MFFCLINNYLICYKEGVKESGKQCIAKEVFDFEKYLSFFDEQTRPFMNEFCKTQGFHTFIEKSLNARKEKNEILFFQQGVSLCSKKGDKALAIQVKKIKDQLLQNNRSVNILSILVYSHFLFL